MPFTRWGYEFDGAYRLPDNLEGRAGVYVVWCKAGDQWGVLDVGESANVRERLATHERRPCLERYCTQAEIYYSATYTDSTDVAGRVRIEQHIRDAMQPPCGDRASAI